jgi:pimeloyl-ACP methyl ester carboxylesterase
MRALYLEDPGAFLRYVEVPGEDPPLLWLHGIFCSSTGELASTAVQEPLAGRRSLLIDFLGYGFSDKPQEFGYTLEDHARTIVALLDGLQFRSCYLIGHSFGGTVAALVAHQRPNVVAALIMAEAAIDPGGGAAESIAEPSEEEFATRRFPDMVESQEQEAVKDPEGVVAAHVGMTRLLWPRGLHRAARSRVRGTDPSVRSILQSLQVPRFYLGGENSDEALEPQQDLVSAGVRWLTVPQTGHPMGIQNPRGFAETIAEALSSVSDQG